MTTDRTSPATGGYVQPEIDVRALTEVLDGEYAEVRDLVRANLVTYASVLDEAEELDIDAFRERVRELVVEMAATGQTGMGFPKRYGGGGDVGASIAAFETLAFGDLSVLVKVGVQFGLFGGAILHLGTERHHDAHLPGLITGELMGCFAMTETGHGSNVQALGTVARYDADAQEFVITTEGDQARKDYIGNAARHGELAVVFAQLEVGGESRGCTRSSCRSGSTARPRPVSTSRTTAARWASTVSTTDASGSTVCGWTARRCSTASPTSPRKAPTRARSTTRTVASSPCSAPWCRAASASAAPGSTPPRSPSRSPRSTPCGDASSRPAPRGGAAAPRLRTAPAASAAAHRPYVRTALRPGRRPHPAPRRLLRPGGRRAGATPAGGPGRRNQGARHLARHPGDPGVPRGVRRRRLSRRQPLRRAQGRQRHLHHVRGRQPRPAPARRQGPAHRLRE